MNHTINTGLFSALDSPAQNLCVIHQRRMETVLNREDSGDEGLFRVIVEWEKGDNPSFRQVKAVSQKLLEVLGVEECPAYIVQDDSNLNAPSIVLVAKGLYHAVDGEVFWRERREREGRITSALQQLDREFGWGEFQGKSRDADVKKEDVPDLCDGGAVPCHLDTEFGWGGQRGGVRTPDVKKDDVPGIQRDEEAYSWAVAWLEDGAKFGCMHDIPNLLREDAEKYVSRKSQVFKGGEKMDVGDCFLRDGNLKGHVQDYLRKKHFRLKWSLGLIREKLREARHMTPSSSLPLATRLAGRIGEQDERGRVDFER